MMAATWIVGFSMMLLINSGEGSFDIFDPSTLLSTGGTDKGSVDAGGCKSQPETITLAVGDYSVFSSPNFPDNFPMFSGCNWKFQTAETNQLALSCSQVELPCLSYLIVVDGEEEISEGDPFNYIFGGTNAEIKFSSLLWGKGFNCTMKAVKPCKCGVKGTTSKIVGGTEVTEDDYGWMAILARAGQNSNFCGGSLITSTHVLTAAHCTIIWATADEIDVRLGVHSKSSNPEGEFRSRVQQILQHESYKSNQFDFDISILVINEVDFTKYPAISIVCLPAGTSDYADTEAVVAGWGRTSLGGSAPDVLLEANVTVISNSACQDIYSAIAATISIEISITDSMICSGSSNTNVCRGDSGGPMMSTTEVDHLKIIGITNFGWQCGAAKEPSVFARVPEYMTWINGKIDSSLYCTEA